ARTGPFRPGSGVSVGSRLRLYSERSWVTRRALPKPAALSVSSPGELAKPYFKGGLMSSEKLLHPAGGSTLRAGFPARSRSRVGGKGCGCCGEVACDHAANLLKAQRSLRLSTGLAVD